MNETIETILGRRSIRKFKEQKVEGPDMDIILKCGMYAPSARNSQNWHFTVLENKGSIEFMNRKIIAQLTPEQKQTFVQKFGKEDFSMFYEAKTLVIVGYPKGDKWGPANCAFAVQNMLLAAHSLGVGSCIIGWADIFYNSIDPKEKERTIRDLGMPLGYEHAYTVVLGYPEEEPKEPPRDLSKKNWFK